MFWSDEAEQAADRTKVADYLAREAGKWRQKMPPAGFVGVGRFYGSGGRSVGFEPECTTTWLDPLVAAEVERRLVRWVGWKLAIVRHGAPPAGTFAARRRGDGVTAFGLGPDQAARLLRWSEAAATRKHRRDAWWAQEPPRDLDTGELVSVQEPGSPVQDVGLHGFQVATHSGRRVAVAEHSLDVEQVELVAAVGTDGTVEDSRRRPA